MHLATPNTLITRPISPQPDELVCDGAARSQYSLTYLEPLARRFGPGDNVTIQFGENFPLAMNFTFEDGAAEVDYFLAPRVESDY